MFFEESGPLSSRQHKELLKHFEENSYEPPVQYPTKLKVQPYEIQGCKVIKAKEYKKNLDNPVKEWNFILRAINAKDITAINLTILNSYFFVMDLQTIPNLIVDNIICTLEGKKTIWKWKFTLRKDDKLKGKISQFNLLQEIEKLKYLQKELCDLGHPSDLLIMISRYAEFVSGLGTKAKSLLTTYGTNTVTST